MTLIEHMPPWRFQIAVARNDTFQEKRKYSQKLPFKNQTVRSIQSNEL